MLSHTRYTTKPSPLLRRTVLLLAGPGWTSEQNPTVKYLNSCMRPLRTQFRPSKYLYSVFFIQLISLSGSCRFRAVPAQVLHLWADCSGKPICSRWCFFFLMKHICVSSIVKHLFSKASENLRWLPGNKMDVFHHCIHEFCVVFFPQSSGLFLQQCLEIRVWNAALKLEKWESTHISTKVCFSVVGYCKNATRPWYWHLYLIKESVF